MNTITQDITVRSISVETRSRLDALKAYTRLAFGSLIDDAVEALWAEYLSEGHNLSSGPQEQPGASEA